MLQVVEQTHEEKIAMYMECSKEKLIEMLMENQRIVKQLTPSVIYDKEEDSWIEYNYTLENYKFSPRGVRFSNEDVMLFQVGTDSNFKRTEKDAHKIGVDIVKRYNLHPKLKEQNKLLREALQNVVDSFTKGNQGDIEEHKSIEDKTVGEYQYWSPSGAIVSSEFIAAARIALEQTK